MPGFNLSPLMPIVLLLIGAAIILILGPIWSAGRRHVLMVGASALAVLGLFYVGLRVEASADPAPLQVLSQSLNEPFLVLRVSRFEPFVWILMLSLLAVSLAWRDTAQRVRLLDYAVLVTLIAAADGAVMSANYLSLAVTLLIFDGVAAAFLVTHARADRAVGRLLLGVLSSATMVALTPGLGSDPLELGGLFSVTIWLRLTLYPLVGSDVQEDWSPPIWLGWTVGNLAVGLYLLSTGVAPWIVWLAGPTVILHGVLAWLESKRERALAHSACALAGGILVIAADVGYMPEAIPASMSILVGLVALSLTPPRLGRPNWHNPWQLVGYLPPLLATASLVGIPFTLGWVGRGGLYRAGWQAGALGVVGLLVIGEGAALSVIFRYWRRLLGGTSARPDMWRIGGAAVVTVVFLIPFVGPNLLSRWIPAVPQSLSAGQDWVGPLAGLIGSLLWAFFLGYGRRRLLHSLPLTPDTLMGVFRLGWLLRGLENMLDTAGRILLRFRAIIEGEHYVAWAILLTMGMVLLAVLR